jgi:hypothetical protein
MMAGYPAKMEKIRRNLLKSRNKVICLADNTAMYAQKKATIG